MICGKVRERKGKGPAPRTCGQRCRQRLARLRKSQPFPKSMMDADRWVRADGKRPVMPDGAAASSTDAGTWSAFPAVLDGAGDGFGFMLGGGFGCYDLDDALEGDELKSWVVEFLPTIQEPIVYVERSVSGRGLHVFVEADEGRGCKRPVGDGRVERYSRGRFIRCGVPFEL